MTDKEKLNEVVRGAANACLPSNTEEFHLRMFVTHLIGSGVTVQKHGRWTVIDECANEGAYCSVCNKKVYRVCYGNCKMKSPYCPNCGAKMERRHG